MSDCNNPIIRVKLECQQCGWSLIDHVKARTLWTNMVNGPEQVYIYSVPRYQCAKCHDICKQTLLE